MGITIVDILKEVENRLHIKEELKLYKETRNEVFFYNKNLEDRLLILIYDKLNRDIFVYRDIGLDPSFKESYMEIISLDRNRVIFTIYKEEEIYLFSYGDSLELLYRFSGDNIIHLRDNYYIFVKYVDDHASYYLLDVREASHYLIDTSLFRETNMNGLRLISLNDRDYLAHIKYSMDGYDLQYCFDYENLDEESSGAYLFDFKKFVKDVKEAREIGCITLMEGDSDSYINPVVYDPSYENKNYKSNYHFIRIRKNSLDLYFINKDLEAELETTVDTGAYREKFRFHAYDYPVKIDLESYGFISKEYRRFYPEEIVETLENRRLTVTDITEDYIIAWGWDEPGKTIYYDYTMIIDRRDSSNYIKIQGDGRLLDDGKTLLIFDKTYMKQESALLKAGEGWATNLREIFKALKGRQLDYNFLVSDFQLVTEDKDLEASLNNKDYLYLSGEDLSRLVEENEIQWIWGVFSAFSKNRDREDLVDYLPRAEDYPGYWEDEVEIQHPLSEWQIVAFDSTASLIISEEKDLVTSFREYFKDSVDLEKSNRTIRAQLKYIEDILEDYRLVAGDKIKEEAILIWNEHYKKSYMDPRLDIDEDFIMSLYKLNRI